MDIFKKWIFSRNEYFQKVDILKKWIFSESGYFQRWLFSESGYFQKVDISRKWIFSESGYFQEMGISQKYKIFKNVKSWLFKVLSKVDILENMIISSNVKRIDQMWIFFDESF